MKTILSFLFFLIPTLTFCQDTFSIVALDPETGEVGSAGASCVDLFGTGLSEDDFLGVLFPDLGAINSQAWYLPGNQNNATDRMFLGDTPQEIIDWLIANDVQGAPELRQYGIVAFVDGMPQSAGHTGSSTDDYKNHIAGPNYCIQGNILLGAEVLENMESNFLNAEGDLACKIMAAMQGANMIGADSRCSENGTSSLFAFLKVAQPNDEFTAPSFLISLRTHDGDGIEPIDSLQVLFDLERDCSSVHIDQEEFDSHCVIFPNPAKDRISLRAIKENSYDLEILDQLGNLIYTSSLKGELEIDIASYSKGVYLIRISTQTDSFTSRFVKN